MKAEFPIHPVYTAISMGYRNDALIADMILPRVPVGGADFRWTKYDIGNSFQNIDLKVDRRSKPMEVDWTGTEDSAFVEDYALDAPIPYRDLLLYQQNAAQGLPVIDIRALKTEQITDILLLGREARVAAQVLNAANYGSANKTTLSGTDQWTDATSDPVAAILDALDSMWIRPNKVVMGHKVFSALRQHPKVTAAMNPAGGNASVRGGVESRQAIADLFELDEVIVGRGRVNTAHVGQAPTWATAWGNDALFFYQAPVVGGPEANMTFGFTAQWGPRLSGVIADPDMGMRGGERIRVGESVRELIVASEAAFLFKAAV